MTDPSRSPWTLGSPKHGWLPMRVCVGGLAFEVEASNVLNDPVAELIVLLEASIWPAWIWIWEEPGGYTVRAIGVGDGAIEVALWKEGDLHVGRHWPTRPPMAEARLSPLELTALREHLEAWAIEHADAIGEHWSEADYVGRLRR